MMADMRTKVGTVLMIAVLSALGATHALAATGTTGVRYVCDSAAELVVMRNATVASVRFIGRTYELRRKASSIGVKYISTNAALIIDGKSAVFVADDQLSLGTCSRA
jgi:hypothetical protein